MKINFSVTDKKIFKMIDSRKLREHLQTHGWQEQGKFYEDTGSIWRLKKNGDRKLEILIPLEQSLGDYAARISDAIKTLELVENRPQLEILGELVTQINQVNIQGFIRKINPPNADSLSGEIILLGVLFEQLHQIKTELFDQDYILAIKAYQERLPVQCTGDLVKEKNLFILKNPQNFTIIDYY